MKSIRLVAWKTSVCAHAISSSLMTGAFAFAEMERTRANFETFSAARAQRASAHSFAFDDCSCFAYIASASVRTSLRRSLAFASIGTVRGCGNSEKRAFS